MHMNTHIPAEGSSQQLCKATTGIPDFLLYFFFLIYPPPGSL